MRSYIIIYSATIEFDSVLCGLIPLARAQLYDDMCCDDEAGLFALRLLSLARAPLHHDVFCDDRALLFALRLLFADVCAENDQCSLCFVQFAHLPEAIVTSFHVLYGSLIGHALDTGSDVDMR